jgi:hypothetical protein
VRLSSPSLRFKADVRYPRRTREPHGSAPYSQVDK